MRKLTTAKACEFTVIVSVVLSFQIWWFICNQKCFDFYWGLLAMTWAPVVTSYLLSIFLLIKKLSSLERILSYVIAGLLCQVVIALMSDVESKIYFHSFYIYLFLPAQLVLVVIADFLLRKFFSSQK